MTYKYTIQGENGRVGGSNKDYDWILKERDAIMKALFPNYVLVEKILDKPEHSVYEYGEKKVYFKIEKEDDTNQ